KGGRIQGPGALILQSKAKFEWSAGSIQVLDPKDEGKASPVAIGQFDVAADAHLKIDGNATSYPVLKDRWLYTVAPPLAALPQAPSWDEFQVQLVSGNLAMAGRAAIRNDGSFLIRAANGHIVNANLGETFTNTGGSLLTVDVGTENSFDF